MASFSLEDFVGDGVLRELLPKLVEQGWDDVPTLKIINLEDMDALNMNQQQKDALEMRSYLHDRALMQYGDKFEASGKCLPELLGLSYTDLSSQFGMKRGHIARFLNRSTCTEDRLLPTATTSGGRMASLPSRNGSSLKSYSSGNSRITGFVAAGPAEPRLCGCLKAPSVVDQVAPYSVIENISLQKLTRVYKFGMERMVKTKTPPMKTLQLWQDQPAVLLCIRRPGCIMCRAEAHKIYTKKPIFDALGVQLYAVLHEHIDSEIKDFWPRYWGGVVLFDQGMEFFKALGGGKLLRDKFLSGFVFNSRAIANYKRAKAIGMEHNFKGEGEIKGGLFIMGKGKSGVAYQFIERNFGDWAPLSEVIEICSQLQNHQQVQEESIKTTQADK